MRSAPINRRGLLWTWRITTETEVRYAHNCTVADAVLAAGMAGPESVQPATEAERLLIPSRYNGRTA